MTTSALNFNIEWAALHITSEADCWFVVQYYGLALCTRQLLPCFVLEQGNRDLLTHVIGTTCYRSPGLGIPQLQRISFEILMGLAELHILQFVHRDLKPANVILTGSCNTAKLIDLGSFKDVTMMKTGEWLSGVCTRDYAGPEQLKPELGVAVTTAGAYKMDSWSFGATMLFMATGRGPFGEFPEMTSTMEERLAALESSDIATLLEDYKPLGSSSKLGERLPEEAMEVLKGALRWHWSDRLSAGELLRLEWYRQLRGELVQQVKRQQVKEGAPIKQLVEGWVAAGLV
jgi:serine/threonine protein kinase